MTSSQDYPPIHDTDRELIEAINNGEPERFAELVARYEGRLYNFGRRMCGSLQDAEDMVQDTFFNVFKYLKGFRGESKFKNWLYRVAASACAKKKRKSKFAPERELSLEEFLPQEGAALPTEVPAWASAPLDKLLDRELGDQLRQTILDLPESHRPVLVLRDLEGFSTAETAQILGLSTANVKVKLHRARLFVRERIKDYFDHGTRRPLQ